MLVGSVKNASLFQKFTLNLIGFGVCDLGEPIRCHSSLPLCLIETWCSRKSPRSKRWGQYIWLWYLFFAEYRSFCKLSSKVVLNWSLEKCHDKPSLEWNLISVKLWKIKRSDQTDCGFSIGTWMSYNTRETSEIRVSSKIDRIALTETLS